MPRVIKKIRPEEWYSLTMLANNKLIPFLGSDIRRYRRFVDNDRKAKNLLKSVVIGEGRYRRYRISGTHLISLLKSTESGKIKSL